MTKEILEPIRSIEDIFRGRGFDIPVEPIPELWSPKIELRGLIRGYDDIQRDRIRMGNRILGNLYRRFGLKPGEKKEGLSGLPKELMVLITREYKRITDGVVVNMKEIPKIMMDAHPGIISSEVMFVFVKTYKELVTQEYVINKEVEKFLDEFPIWTDHLKGLSGVGPTMGGVVVSELDPHKANHVTSFWSYAGLDVVWTVDTIDGVEVVRGEGRSKKAHHLVDREYVDKAGHTKTKKSITYSPYLKTKLHVLATSFLRKQDDVYSPIFYDYRTRMQGRREFFVRGLKNKQILYKKDPHDSEGLLTLSSTKYELCKKWREKQKKTPTLAQTKKFVTSNIISDNHIKNMSIRYMLKIFLLDLWSKWRELEGLPVSSPYEVEKLGIVHSK
jgi:hypothetical protein